MEQQIEGQGTAAQTFAYEIREDSAVILRCFSRDVRAEIPEYLEGYPVTEVAPYAFSEHFENRKLQEELRTGRARLYVPEAMRLWSGQENAPEVVRPGDGQEYVPEAIWPGNGQDCVPEAVRPVDGQENAQECVPGGAPALCGGRLEEIVLPPTLRRVGRYCFYDCGNLRRIEFHGALSDWGSGAFTGCHHVRELCVFTDEAGQSHLKDVLDELREELETEYYVRVGRTQETEGSSAVRLIFPEFYEEGVENTPARILETHVHGSGILYRNCFRGRVFDFAQYDALFPYARAWESEELVIRMALWRLRSGYGLTAEAAARYTEYVAEHARQAGTWLLDRRDLEGLRFLLALVQAHRSVPETDGAPGASRGQAPHGGFGESGAQEPHGDFEASRGQGSYGEPRVSRTQELHGDPVPSGMRDTLLPYFLEKASGMHYMEAVSFLMEQTRGEQRARPAARRRFEL